MADKKLFGKIAGTAFQAVGTAANVVGGAANLVGTTASVAGKAVSAVGKAANAVGEKMKDDAPTSVETASPDAEEELEVTTLAPEPDDEEEDDRPLPKERLQGQYFDFKVYQTFLLKKKRRIDYQTARRVCLKTNVPVKLSYCQRALDRARPTANRVGDADLVGQVDGLSGLAGGYAISLAIGAVAALDGAPESHFQIWIETDKRPEGVLLCSTRHKADVDEILKTFLKALEKYGARPEITLDGQPLELRKITRASF